MTSPVIYMPLNQDLINANLTVEQQWPCGVVVACLLHTQEVPGSIPGRGSYLRQVSLH